MICSYSIAPDMRTACTASPVMHSDAVPQVASMCLANCTERLYQHQACSGAQGAILLAALWLDKPRDLNPERVCAAWSDSLGGLSRCRRKMVLVADNFWPVSAGHSINIVPRETHLKEN